MCKQLIKREILMKKIIIRLMEQSVIFKKAAQMLLPLYFYIQKKRQNHLFHRHGMELLTHFKSCLNKRNVDFWLSSGTLLGAYREHKLLGHDLDLDVAMFIEDKDKAAAALIDGGFRLEHEFGIVGEEGIKEQSFSYRNVKIDIFYTEKIGNNFVNHAFFKDKVSSKNDDFNVIEVHYPVTDFVEYDFCGNKFLIPAKTVEWLTCNYGENFMVPNKNWDYHTDIPAAKYWPINEKRGYCIFH